jgi:hypothetical protein
MDFGLATQVINDYTFYVLLLARKKERTLCHRRLSIISTVGAALLWNMPVRNELGKRVPDLEEISSTSKAHAVWIAQNYTEVEQFRIGLSKAEREKLNHPSNLKKRVEAARGSGANCNRPSPRYRPPRRGRAFERGERPPKATARTSPA